MIRLIIIAAFTLLSACSGSSDSDDEDEADDTPSVPDGAVEMPFLSQLLTVDDALFGFSCNSLMMDFVVTKESPCAAVKVDSDVNADDEGGGYTTTWTWASPDKAINITGVEDDEEKEIIKIDDVNYHCLQISTDARMYNADGDNVYGSFTLMASEPFKKPSEVKADKVLFVGMTSQDICKAAH